MGSLRIDGTLAEGERESLSRALTSARVAVRSWGEASVVPRTYVMLDLPPDFEPPVDGAAPTAQRLALPPGSRFDEPPLCVLEIALHERSRVGAVARALGGPGRPAAVVEVHAGERAVLVEFTQQTPLRLIVDIVDAELEHAPGRTVRPLLPLTDDALAAFAGATLGIADLDANRLIETFTEPLLAKAPVA